MSKNSILDNERAASGFIESNGIRIYYETFGQGKPIILIHGWSSSLKRDWIDTKWVKALTPNRRVIALDCRGHGQSDKPHDQEAYSYKILAQDVLNLMDHLNINKTDIFGYSQGAMIAIYLLGHHKERIKSAILGGIGNEASDVQQVVDGLLAEDPLQISNQAGKGLRLFAEIDPNNDLKALALMFTLHEATFNQVGGIGLADVNFPVLIVNGGKDDLVENVDELATTIPGAKLIIIKNRNHLTVIPDKRFKNEVLSFLEQV